MKEVLNIDIDTSCTWVHLAMVTADYWLLCKI